MQKQIKASTRSQSGGTLLGFIIGLIIGLGIAVAVAVTIKNSPLPFSSKSGSQEKRGAPATAAPGDPNKPLYGNKDAAREAAKEFARKMEERGVVPAVDGSNDTPVPDRSAQQAGAAPATGDARFAYYLQAGAFLQQADAENTKGRLALLGVSANISERRAESGTMYRVRIGPFASQDAMNRMRSKLSDNGVDVAVVRIPK